jgi:fatty acid desaturase
MRSARYWEKSPMTYYTHKGDGTCASCDKSCIEGIRALSDDMPDRRYKRGYDTTHLPEAIQKRLKDAEASAPVANVAEAILTVASIALLAVLFWWAASHVSDLTHNPGLTVALFGIGYVPTAILIARQQRGLELMVHDASHRAWIRSLPTLNDKMADLLVAYPMLSSVEAYWKSHRSHHGSFGSHLDPCRQRFANMGLAHLDLSTKWKIARAVIAWLAPYNKAYYEEIGSLSLRQWARFAIWHTFVFIVPTTVLLSSSDSFDVASAVPTAFVIWMMFWMFPQIAFLPVSRSIAEAEEHDYNKGKTEFETTYTNDGWLHRLLIHPKNDSYHLVHHMFPNIPERRHRRIHMLLMEHDPRYRTALRRSSVLGPH